MDRLDLVFTYGTLKQETRQIILDMLNDAGLDSDEKKAMDSDLCGHDFSRVCDFEMMMRENHRGG